MIEQSLGDADVVAATMQEAGNIVHNMINLDKPVVSAINWVVVGAGLAVIWPLLCGMAKAKYYFLTRDFLDGKEAERIGLVSWSVPADELITIAMEVARKLSAGHQSALRWTKRSLNQWLRQAMVTSFDYSLALEMLGFFGADMKEGLESVR